MVGPVSVAASRPRFRNGSPANHKSHVASMSTTRRVLLLTLILALGWAFSTMLLLSDNVSGTIFVSLCGLSLIVALAIVNNDRLQMLDLSKLRVILSEIKTESKTIKRLGDELVELLAVNAAFQNRWGSEQTTQLLKQINHAQMMRAMDYLGTNSLAREKVLQYDKLFTELDQIGPINADDPESSVKQKRHDELFNEKLVTALKDHLLRIQDKKS